MRVHSEVETLVFKDSEGEVVGRAHRSGWCRWHVSDLEGTVVTTDPVSLREAGRMIEAMMQEKDDDTVNIPAEVAE